MSINYFKKYYKNKCWDFFIIRRAIPKTYRNHFSILSFYLFIFPLTQKNISERREKKSNETFHKQCCYQNWRDTKYIMKNRLFPLTSIFLPYIFPDILLVWAKGVERDLILYVYFFPEKEKKNLRLFHGRRRC